jgi:DNA repair exonuclease SbcCD nuclease subunit
MHHSFDGAKTGPHEFTPPASLKVSDIPEVIGGVFSGHYHLHQKLHKKMMYVGAPLQHDFGETHYTPGYMILNFDEKKCVLKGVTRRETPEDVAPRFYAIPHTTDPSTPPGNPDRDYYRIELPANVDVGEIEELKKVLTYVVVRSIALGVDTRSRVEEYLKDEQKAEGRVALPDVIDAYAVMNESNEARARELASVGREIAEEVLGEV